MDTYLYNQLSDDEKLQYIHQLEVKFNAYRELNLAYGCLIDVLNSEININKDVAFKMRGKDNVDRHFEEYLSHLEDKYVPALKTCNCEATT